MRWSAMECKLALYGAYAGSAAFPRRLHGLVLLIVTCSPQREAQIRQRAAAMIEAEGLTVLTSTSALVERLGPFGSAWQGSESVGRVALLDALHHGVEAAFQPEAR
jgi:hypothetical protein